MEATRITNVLSVNDGLVSSAKLFKNVQFIYELYLAELELKALGVKFEISKGCRNFKIFNGKEDIKKRSAYFEEVSGEHTHYFMITQKNRTNSVNQYLTHWFYPYKGKFHPQMIRALINIIGVRDGQIVLDPFSGSGTTALECMLLGVDFIGYDISPLCVIIGRVKTESVHALSEIEGLKNDILRYSITLKGEEYYSFLDKLTNNEIVKNFYKLVRLIAISDLSRRKKDYKSSFVKNLHLMLLSVKDMKEIKESLNLSFGKISIEEGDARNLKLPDNSVDGIITSPPYSIALDYVQNDIHALKDLGYNHKEIREWFIGVRGNGKERIELYNEDMKKAYKEMYRVLKPNRYAVIVIGNAKYQGREIDTVGFTIDYMEGLEFKLEENIDKIIFGLYNVMKDENVLIFKKHDG